MTSPYTVAPLAPESMPRAIDIRASAFKDTPASRALRPNGFSPSVKDWYVQDDLKCMAKRNHYYMGVTDNATGQLVAYSSWHLYDQEEHAASGGNDPPPPDMNAEAYVVFFGNIDRAKKKVMGTRDFWYLEILATHSDFKGKGAGTLLLRWGMEKALSQGLEIFLDATEAGRPLYERMGFVTEDYTEFDLNPFGVDHLNTQYGMVRQPRPLP